MATPRRVSAKKIMPDLNNAVQDVRLEPRQTGGGSGGYGNYDRELTAKPTKAAGQQNIRKITPKREDTMFKSL